VREHHFQNNASIINCTTTVPPNRVKVNKDLVRKTRYKVPPNRIAKRKPPEAPAVAKIRTSTGNPTDPIGYPLLITAGPILPLQGIVLCEAARELNWVLLLLFGVCERPPRARRRPRPCDFVWALRSLIPASAES
jgi:hypothetical protein